jgi:hypothetical protein
LSREGIGFGGGFGVLHGHVDCATPSGFCKTAQGNNGKHNAGVGGCFFHDLAPGMAGIKSPWRTADSLALLG